MKSGSNKHSNQKVQTRENKQIQRKYTRRNKYLGNKQIHIYKKKTLDHLITKYLFSYKLKIATTKKRKRRKRERSIDA